MTSSEVCSVSLISSAAFEEFLFAAVDLFFAVEAVLFEVREDFFDEEDLLRDVPEDVRFFLVVSVLSVVAICSPLSGVCN